MLEHLVTSYHLVSAKAQAPAKSGLRAQQFPHLVENLDVAMEKVFKKQGEPADPKATPFSCSRYG